MKAKGWLTSLTPIWDLYYRRLSTSLPSLFPRERSLDLPNRLCPLLLDFSLSFLCFIWDFCNFFPVRKEPDAIIVLGSGLIGDKVPPLLAQRLTKAKTIYEQFEGRPKLIVSGGQGADELISEAEAMANYLMEQGVPQEDILIEDRSRTTFENLTFSKAILEDHGLGKSVLVVTNSFHALRAGVFMRRLKIPGRSVGSKQLLLSPIGLDPRNGWASFSLLEMACCFLSFSISALVLSQIMSIVNYFFIY